MENKINQIEIKVIRCWVYVLKNNSSTDLTSFSIFGNLGVHCHAKTSSLLNIRKMISD